MRVARGRGGLVAVEALGDELRELGRDRLLAGVPGAGVPGGVLLEAVLDQGGHVHRAGDGRRGGRQLVEAVLRRELTRGQAALLDSGLADGARALAIGLRRAVPGGAER